MFGGIALGAAAFMAVQPQVTGGNHVIYHDDTGTKHPDGDLRGVVEKKTAVFMIVGAVAVFLAGVSIRER